MFAHVCFTVNIFLRNSHLKCILFVNVYTRLRTLRTRRCYYNTATRDLMISYYTSVMGVSNSKTTDKMETRRNVIGCSQYFL